MNSIETTKHPPSWFLTHLTQCFQQAKHCFDILWLIVMNEKLVAYGTNKGVTWEKNELAQKRLIRFFSEINQIYGRTFIFS